MAMARRKFRVEASEESKKFMRNDVINVNGFEINRGDIIKIKDMHGSKFKFDYLVTNIRTGATWVDCYEIINKVPSVFRSFRLDRVKRVPQKGKRGKRVSRTEDN